MIKNIKIEIIKSELPDLVAISKDLNAKLQEHGCSITLNERVDIGSRREYMATLFRGITLVKQVESIDIKAAIESALECNPEKEAVMRLRAKAKELGYKIEPRQQEKEAASC